jgi:hypothetical protein
MPIPAFRLDGYLPEGLHRATEAEVTDRFGQETERPRFDGTRRHLVVFGPGGAGEAISP